MCTLGRDCTSVKQNKTAVKCTLAWDCRASALASAVFRAFSALPSLACK